VFHSGGSIFGVWKEFFIRLSLVFSHVYISVIGPFANSAFLNNSTLRHWTYARLSGFIELEVADLPIPSFPGPRFCYRIRGLENFALFCKFLENGWENCICYFITNKSTGSTKCPHSGGLQVWNLGPDPCNFASTPWCQKMCYSPGLCL